MTWTSPEKANEASSQTAASAAAQETAVAWQLFRKLSNNTNTSDERERERMKKKPFAIGPPRGTNLKLPALNAADRKI